MVQVGQILRWLGGKIDIKVEASLAIEADGALWGIGLWDQSAWASVDGLYEDISEYVMGVEIERGFERWGDRPLAGRLTVELDNTDGRFTPDAGAEPFDYSFRPGRKMRVLAYPDPEAEGAVALITARVDESQDVAADAGADIVANAVATDALAELGAIDPPAGSATGVQRSDQRVTAALDNVSWPADQRAIDVGLVDVQSSTLAGTPLEEIMRAAEAEGGLAYADAENRIVFRWRNWLVGGIEPTMEPYALAVEASEPLAYWRMSGAAADADETGNGHDLTWNGGPATQQDGVRSDDEAVSLDQTNDYATVASEAALELAQDMTIEMWVRPHDSSGSDQAIITCRGASTPLYEIYRNPSDQAYTFYPGASAGVGEGLGTGFPANEWTHLVVTVRWTLTSRTILGYVNGVLQGGATRPFQPGAETRAINIGRRATAADLYFDGDISELAIYDRVLSADEILSHYQAQEAPNVRSTEIQGYIGYGDDVPDPSVPSSELVGVEWSYETARVENDVQLARTGGSAQQAQDINSQIRYGRRSYQFFDLINNTDTDVAFLAARRLASNRDLRRRIESVTLAANADPDNDDLNRLFYTLQIGDLVSVKVQTLHGWSFEGLGHVFGIKHRITPDDWEVTYRIDDSLIGAHGG